VDADGNAILATNAFWGYCTSECPSDEGYPATGAGPACSVRTTGRGFPESCAAQQNKTDKNILFIGNSYTFYNNLQNMVRDLAIAAGFSPTVYSESRGGETLGGHVLNSLAAIRSDEWDVVVIQDQSQRPSFPNGYVYYNIIPESTTLVKAINDQNPCTVPVFFQTWGKRDGDSQNCADGNYLCFFDGIQNRLTESYNTFAYVNQPAKVAPAGEAFRIYENRGALFDSDGSHPSLAGSYLTACTLLETIWGVSCEGNSYQPVGDAIVLQEVAHQTLSSWNWEWPASGGPPCPHCFPPSFISPHRK